MAAPSVHSPLRYPGGKAVLAAFLSRVIEINEFSDGVYAEPFAGGAGAALELLYSGRVERIMLNDADPCVFAFWESVLAHPDEFIRLLEGTPVTVDEWKRQREVYLSPAEHTGVEVGFATFFLNRCNRSGILLNAGPIGGYDQSGAWKIDARFNRQELRRRIEKLSLFSEHIAASNLDALDFLRGPVADVGDEVFVYLDPPYYVKGSKLYMNHYGAEDHANLARFMADQTSFRWIMSYDNVVEIRDLYRGMSITPFSLQYSAQGRSAGSELLIHTADLKVPYAEGLVSLAS
ncbi:MAG: DNA adenine methylase [Coriobacteriia bacterium]